MKTVLTIFTVVITLLLGIYTFANGQQINNELPEVQHLGAGQFKASNYNADALWSKYVGKIEGNEYNFYFVSEQVSTKKAREVYACWGECDKDPFAFRWTREIITVPAQSEAEYLMIDVGNYSNEDVIFYANGVEFDRLEFPNYDTLIYTNTYTNETRSDVVISVNVGVESSGVGAYRITRLIPINTLTPTATATWINTPTPTATVTPFNTATSTSTVINTETPIATITATIEPTPTVSKTLVQPTPTTTLTPTPTNTVFVEIITEHTPTPTQQAISTVLLPEDEECNYQNPNCHPTNLEEAEEWYILLISTVLNN